MCYNKGTITDKQEWERTADEPSGFMKSIPNREAAGQRDSDAAAMGEKAGTEVKARTGSLQNFTISPLCAMFIMISIKK